MAQKAPKQEINLSDLKGNPKNPRFMREENAQALQSSISKLGDLSCIVYNERTGLLVGGHQRKNVILQLIGENPKIEITHEYDEPNEVRTTKEGFIAIGSEHYKVRFVDFSEEDEALAIIIANDKRNQGEYDMGILPTIVDIADKSILSVDFGLMDFVEGFNFLWGSDGNQEEDDGNGEHVEFDASKNGEIDTETLTGETAFVFKLSAKDYQRTIERLAEIKQAQSLDTNEEALMFILFA